MKSLLLSTTLILGIAIIANAQKKVTPNILINTKISSSAYGKLKLAQLSKSKNFKPPIIKTIPIVSRPTEVIELSNKALYNIPDKTAYGETTINADCNALPINYKISQQEIGLFFPPTSFVDKIYPGAVYQFSGLKTQSPSIYTKFFDRNAMNLTTNIFDPRVTNNAPEQITQFDYGTVSGKWKGVLAKYIGGATPADVITEVMMVESDAQMNADLNTIGNVTVGTTLKVPIPNIPVTVNASNEVSVTNTSQVTSSSENKKNSVIFRFKQVFYSASVSPLAVPNQDVFKNTDKTQLENDLVYISSVDYGQMFYVTVTSEYSKEAMFKAVLDKVTTQSNLGVQATGLPVGGSVSVGTSNETSSETNSILSNSSVTIKSFQYGGAPVYLGTTMDEVLASLKNKIKLKFDSTNLGAPLSYTLNFVSDHSPAWINTNTNYATALCGINLEDRRYDVKVKLVKATAIKVDEGFGGDATEDLFGNMYVKFRSGSISKDEMDIWKKDGATYANNSATNQVGVSAVSVAVPVTFNIEKTMANNLTNQQLLDAEISISGNVKDKDLGDPAYACVECNSAPLKIKLSSFISTLNTLNAGETKLITSPTLNYFEGGDDRKSNVKFHWEISVRLK